MKSIYESARFIMERLGATGAAQNDANKAKNISGSNSNMSPQARNYLDRYNKSAEKVGGFAQDKTYVPVKSSDPKTNRAVVTKDKPPVSKPQAQAQSTNTPVKKVEVNKPDQATMAAAPSQDKLNATQRSAEKSGPDTDDMKKNIVKVPTATAAAEAPKKYEMDKGPDDEGTQKTASSYSTNTSPKPAEVPDSVKVNDNEASATKPNDSGGMRGNFSTAKGSSDSNEPSKPSGSPMAGVKPNAADKPQAALTPPAADNTVKDRSGNVVRSGDGSPVRTRTDAEIERDNKRGRGRGMSMESVNKKFDITDALYQSVMEVMKKDKKEGSIPRNSEEEKLAAFHGDPKRITHGDVLKARGVTKEEAEPVEEMSSKMKMKLGLYGKKKKTNEESVEEGMMSAAKSVAKKVLSKLGGGSDEDQRKDLQRKMGVPQTGKKPMKEGKDTPGNGYAHQCAIHVKSESYGEGRTITTQHADPDAEGNIAWYDVMFEHGIEKQVPTSTLEILVSEMHGHSKKKKM